MVLFIGSMYLINNFFCGVLYVFISLMSLIIQNLGSSIINSFKSKKLLLKL